jgi:arsenate reductase
MDQSMSQKPRVLILCTGNSARSQMAEGLLRHDAGDRFEVFSAGVSPSEVRSEAIAVMREIGVDLTAHRSKHVNEFHGQSFDYVLTVCDHAREVCPVFPAQTTTLHKSFVDPAACDENSPEAERLALFRQVRDEIRRYLRSFPDGAGKNPALSS